MLLKQHKYIKEKNIEKTLTKNNLEISNFVFSHYYYIFANFLFNYMWESRGTNVSI
jgi:hypothetical protein